LLGPYAKNLLMVWDTKGRNQFNSWIIILIFRITLMNLAITSPLPPNFHRSSSNQWPSSSSVKGLIKLLKANLPFKKVRTWEEIKQIIKITHKSPIHLWHTVWIYQNRSILSVVLQSYLRPMISRILHLRELVMDVVAGSRDAHQQCNPRRMQLKFTWPKLLPI